MNALFCQIDILDLPFFVFHYSYYQQRSGAMHPSDKNLLYLKICPTYSIGSANPAPWPSKKLNPGKDLFCDHLKSGAPPQSWIWIWTYWQSAYQKMNRHGVPGKPCTRWILHKASLLIGDTMSEPKGSTGWWRRPLLGLWRKESRHKPRTWTWNGSRRMITVSDDRKPLGYHHSRLH